MPFLCSTQQSGCVYDGGGSCETTWKSKSNPVSTIAVYLSTLLSADTKYVYLVLNTRHISFPPVECCKKGRKSTVVSPRNTRF